MAHLDEKGLNKVSGILRNYIVNQIPNIKTNGDGTKYLNDKGEYKEIPNRLHCELWDDGGDWTITFRDTMEEAVIETEYAKIFDRIKNNENNLTFDVLSNGIEILNNHYNVDYEIDYSDGTRIIIVFHFIDGHPDHDTEYNNPIKISLDIDKDENCGQIFIFKGEEHTNITQLSKVNYINTDGNGTKFLADDGNYKRITDTYYNFDFTNDEYYKLRGTDVIDEYDLENKADVIRLYNSLKADIGKPTFARVITDDIDGYSNDGFSNVTIEENDGNPLYVTFNIVDFLADGTDTDNMILAKKTMDIYAEYGRCDIYDSHVIGLTTGGSGMSVLNDKGEYSINDIMCEVVPEDNEIYILDPKDNTTVIDGGPIGPNSNYENFYRVFNRAVNRGAVVRFKISYKGASHIVIPKIDKDGTLYNIKCTFIYSENPDDEYISIRKFCCELDKSNALFYGIQEKEISLIKLSLIDYLMESGDGNKFLADDGSYVHTSKLITFEAENGSLNAEQTDAIEEGYLRNLPIYILYSGIKMLVNGIQKLGDIYSLSCRHDNSTYSITMNFSDDSYEISSISE